MDRIKQQVDQLQQQLAGLSASQKMLTATLVAIMIATVIWWTRYAATGEMVAVIDQALTVDEIGEMSSLLDRRRVDYVIDGDRLLVTAAERDRAFALLSAGRALPSDTTDHFAQMIGSIGSFDPKSKIDMMQKNALQRELNKIIRAQDNVVSANVMLNTEYQPRLGGNVMPTASVVIQTNGRVKTQELADTVAHLIAGPVAMLEPEAVSVMIDGPRVKISSDRDYLSGGSEFLELSRLGSEHYAQRVQNLLSYIPGLQVAVEVEINDKVLRRLNYRLDDDNKVSMPIREMSTIEDSRNGNNASDPGLLAMEGASLGSGESSRSEASEKNEVENFADVGKSREEILQEAGATRPVTCALSIPFSYVLNQWQQRNGSEEKPDASILDAYEEQMLAGLKQSVSKALGGIDVSEISCMTYADAPMNSPDGSSNSAIAGVVTNEPTAGISGLIKDYGREIAVAALALVSLFLVSTMVKKSAPLSPPAAPTFDGEAITLVGGDELAGTAGGSDDLMVAQEVSDDAVQAGQVLEQVQTLVKENPDAAAALVKRWLNAT